MPASKHENEKEQSKRNNGILRNAFEKTIDGYGFVTYKCIVSKNCREFGDRRTARKHVMHEHYGY
jgi:hypothetical protein